MSLLVLHDVTLGFGARELMSGLDLRLDQGDRIGLVGPNGSGKTTLMRVLAGEANPQSGRVDRRRDAQIGYLPQDIPSGDGRTVLQTVLEAVPERRAVQVALDRAQQELERLQDDGDEQAMVAAAERFAECQQRALEYEAEYAEHQAHRILAGLGFPDAEHQRPVCELSGGWRMRVMLGALLFRRPDVLLLDEPTNHLDMPSVAWLGQFLRRYNRAFVLICHDREFLNEQINRVLSLEPEGARQFRGDYEAYVEWRREQELVLENQARNQQRERDKAQQFIDRFRAQANKAKAVQSRIKQMERLEQVQTFERRQVMRFRLPPPVRAGDEVFRLEHLRKAFDARVVLDDVDLSVSRGDKIGIIGPNGAGKTTLLRILGGELCADGGSVRPGANVAVGYYAQHHADVLHPDRTLFEAIAEHNPDLNQTQVRTLLGAFLFSNDDVDKKIGVLSGGERARVALARLLAAPGNVILMDEPTNHLDLDSSESLAASLAAFEGTLVFVSHNRSFIRRLATKIWTVEDGRVEVYPGTFDEYLARHGVQHEAELTQGQPGRSSSAAGESPAAKAAPSDSRRHNRRREAQRRAERQRRTKPLVQRIAELERDIERLENEQQTRAAELSNPEVYDDPERRDRLLREVEQARTTLAERMAQWEAAQHELEVVEAELADS